MNLEQHVRYWYSDCLLHFQISLYVLSNKKVKRCSKKCPTGFENFSRISLNNAVSIVKLQFRKQKNRKHLAETFGTGHHFEHPYPRSGGGACYVVIKNGGE